MTRGTTTGHLARAALESIAFQSADVLGVPVVRPQVVETTALGAAYVAGLAVGYWASDADVVANWRVDRRFEPSMARDRVADMRARWENAVGRSEGVGLRQLRGHLQGFFDPTCVRQVS